MFDWLHNTVYSLFGSVSGSVKDFVHSVLKGLIGALNAVAGRAWTAWWDLLWGAYTLVTGITGFVQAVYSRLWLILNQYINSLLQDVAALWSQIWRSVAHIFDTVWGWVVTIRDYLWQQIESARQWVIENVWAPLWGWVQDIYDKLTRWAWMAYWYITHPDDLARVLFWSLVNAFARDAFFVARIVGDWLLRTILANIPRSLGLIETIIKDVL